MSATLLLRSLRAAWLRPVLRVEAPTLALLHSARTGAGRRRSWPKAGEDEEEMDWEEEDEGPDMEEVARQLKRQKRAILYQKIKREMEPRGPIQRSLTRATMEQIRQLNQESPEEWTVPRLVEGFNVDSDVIRRILRSKFSPSLAVQLKQDAKVISTVRNQEISKGFVNDQHLNGTCENLPQVRMQPGIEQQQKKMISRHTTKEHPRQVALQLPGGTSVGRTQNFTPEKSGPTQYRPFRTSKQEHQVKAGFAHVVPSLTLTDIRDSETDKVPSYVQEQGEEEWDGELLSEEELERLAECGYKSNMKVVQKGREFFDGEGNFLYRV